MTSVAGCNDAELVDASLAGNREAFSRIVARYQSLVCSLAYNATGSLGQSEDLAQETFITAWKHLAHLRERHKLRAWLCGIARNRINNFLRREGREPVRDAAPLAAVAGSHCPDPLPPEQAISNEEAAILWRSLALIPTLYREPLILFYREHQSIEAVAQSLELTEDTVKQRLSRGRKLLQEQMLAFVEGALARTNPGRAFTLAVVASLPALTISAAAATVGAATTGSASAKAFGAMGLFSMLLGPLMVVLPNFIAYRIALAGADSAEERARIKSLFGKMGAITLALFIPFAVAVLWLTRNMPNLSFLSGLLATGLVLIFLPTTIILSVASQRKSRRHMERMLAEKYRGIHPRPAWEYRSQLQLFGLPLIHIRIGDRFALLKSPVKAWLAVGHAAIGGLFACGGLAVAPVSLGGLAIGVLPVGGLSVGVFALGGIALGLWASFGGLALGWQAIGCIAIAWDVAAGDIALAYNSAFGCFARTLHASNETGLYWGQPLHFSDPGWCFRCAEFINNHWLWLNLFWLVPFFIQWLILRHANRTGQD